MRLGLHVGYCSNKRELHRAPVLLNLERADALAYKYRRVSAVVAHVLGTLTADHLYDQLVVYSISKRFNAGECEIGGAGPGVEQVADEIAGDAGDQGRSVGQ